MTTIPAPPDAAELNFRAYEVNLADIIKNYPRPSRIASTASCSTIRQAIRRALSTYVQRPLIQSAIPRDTALKVYQEFIFADNPDNTIYVGPRRSTAKIKQVAVSIAEGYGPTPAPASLTFPPVDVSDPITRNALFHLKNFDYIPFPVPITNLPEESESSLLDAYPNIELVPDPTTPGAYTLL